MPSPEDDYKALSKSLWVWQTSPDDFPAVLNYADSWGIDRIYFGINTQYWDGIASGQYATAMTAIASWKAAAVGRQVLVATGTPNWATSAGVSSVFTTMVSKVIATNSAFDGVVLDIEPWTLANWSTDSATLCANLRSALPLYKAALPAGKNACWAVTHPSYYAVAGTGNPTFLGDVIDRTDGTVLMAYRNTNALNTSYSANSRSVYAGKSAPWFFGQTLNAGAGTNVTWADKTASEFESGMVFVTSLAQGSGGGIGPAIQSYSTLVAKIP